ncbi:MAG: response regulator, partial [Verrucomicrobia bacterium]|nr:response regulator [Verrucomicrobiota bacterium]
MTDHGNHSNFFHDKEVLLLEDEILLTKRITALLERMGAEVTHTGSIEEARQSLKTLSFDCALFDLNLPDGESLDLLKEHAVP